MLSAAPSPPSSDSPRAVCGGGRSTTSTLPERGPQLPPMEGLQGGSVHSSQVTSRRTQQLPLCPQGCASGSHWGLGLRSGHERTFPLFILHCTRLGQALQHGAYGSSPEYPLPSLSSPALHIHLPAASSLASQQHSGASSTVGHQETVLFFFFREEEGNPAALSWASSTMAGPLGPYLLAWLGRTE